MKLLNHPVDMIAIFDCQGKITPYKFKYEDRPVKVDQVIRYYQEKLAGNIRIVFVCINRGSDMYELKYELDSHKWYLFKK
ncbi:MAG: hypothetical protein JXQ26_03835 [Tissierellales bacterium]|nr:hypothetical protein [Tissierellales bacterium]MBN2827092.1 hypothetical protein [Tissierellales bacterium]